MFTVVSFELLNILSDKLIKTTVLSTLASAHPHPSPLPSPPCIYLSICSLLHANLLILCLPPYRYGSFLAFTQHPLHPANPWESIVLSALPFRSLLDLWSMTMGYPKPVYYAFSSKYSALLLCWRLIPSVNTSESWKAPLNEVFSFRMFSYFPYWFIERQKVECDLSVCSTHSMNSFRLLPSCWRAASQWI